jgi:hypothetical protein
MGVAGDGGALDGDALRAAVARGELLTDGAAAAVVPGLRVLAPLCSGGRVAGALLVFALLPQKPSLGPADLEVLELLREHAARALQAAGGPQRGER